MFGQSRELDAFWAWQERTAEVAWTMAARSNIVLDVQRPLSAHLPDHEALRTFIDGLLSITSQATSERALALCGAAALDFPWRGVAHLENGIGNLSETLVEAIRRAGGRVLTRRKAMRIARERGAIMGVETETGEFFEAEHVIANWTPWNIRELLDLGQGLLPEMLARLDKPERDIEGAWGPWSCTAGSTARSSVRARPSITRSTSAPRVARAIPVSSRFHLRGTRPERLRASGP